MDRESSAFVQIGNVLKYDETNPGKENGDIMGG